MPPADIAGNSLEHKGKNRPSSRAVGSLFAAYLGRNFFRVRGSFPSCFRSRTIQPRDVPDTNPTSIPRRYRSCHTVHNRWAERTRPARTTRNRRRVCSHVETFLATCWPFACRQARTRRPTRTPVLRARPARQIFFATSRRANANLLSGASQRGV